MTKEIKIEDYIPQGQLFAVDRVALASMTGLEDRQNRQLIVEAIERGIPIINNGSGYFICDGSIEDKLAAQEYMRKEFARHRNIIHHIHMLEKALKNTYREDIDNE